MISCQVSMLLNKKYDGAQITTSRTQKAKNHARLASLDAEPANLSNPVTRLLTSLGICGVPRFVR
jgi:hypothetical protein